MAIELKGSRSRKAHKAWGRQRRFLAGLGITIGVLVLLAIIAGVAYIWYMGQTQPLPQTALPETKPRAIVKETKKEPVLGPVGVSSQTFTDQVKQGGNASVTIRTRAEAACSITVTYDDKKSTDTGLLPKTADEFGVAQWTWTVESGRPVGKWPVEITCGLGEESGYLKLDLQVLSAAG